jgi:selenophosphate synthase
LRLQDFAQGVDDLTAVAVTRTLSFGWQCPRDDAAVYALDDERGVVSTTDFMPDC